LNEKKLGTFTLILCFLLLPLIVVACNTGNVVELQYASGQVRFREGTDENKVLTDLKVDAIMQNGRKRRLNTNQLTIGRVDTSIVGQQEVSIGYNDVKMLLSVYIYPIDANVNLAIIGYNESPLISQYRQNKQPGDISASESIFKKNNEPYFVGDINSWEYFPKITTMDEQGNIEDLEVNYFDSDVTIQQVESDGSLTTLMLISPAANEVETESQDLHRVVTNTISTNIGTRPI